MFSIFDLVPVSDQQPDSNSWPAGGHVLFVEQNTFILGVVCAIAPSKFDITCKSCGNGIRFGGLQLNQSAKAGADAANWGGQGGSGGR